MSALDDLAEEPRWVWWHYESRGGKPTKVPGNPHGGAAKANDPRTWGTRTEAEAAARGLSNGGGGIGIQLGDLDSDQFLGGLDLDSCLDEDGTVAPWAEAIVNAVPSYTER